MANLLTLGAPLPELDLFTTDGTATTLRMVRWVMHWADRHDESGYQKLLQVLREAGEASTVEKV